MPCSHADLITHAEVVGLGRRFARREWRTHGRLDQCCAPEDLPPGKLTTHELACMAYGYRDELHSLNAEHELSTRSA